MREESEENDYEFELSDAIPFDEIVNDVNSLLKDKNMIIKNIESPISDRDEYEYLN